MKVYMKSVRSGWNATGEYDVTTKTLTVKKGSILSATISHSKTFKGGARIENLRKDIVKDNILQKDITFTSPSSAANFVTGSSTNGWESWKTETSKSLKAELS